MEEEEEVVLDMKDMKLKQMAEFFKHTDELTQHDMGMDPSSKRSQHFCHGLQSLLAPYKQL